MTKHVLLRSALTIMILAALAPLPVSAQSPDPTACEQFAWSISRERALFSSPDLATQNSGSKLATLPKTAIKLTLEKATDDKKPADTAHGHKHTGPYGGTLEIEQGQAGLYQVTVSAAAWVDVLQKGAPLPVVAHSGKSECAEVRKTLRFDLSAAPLTIALSGLTQETVKVSILPAN